MQHLCLTGSHAAVIADRLFHALNIRPTGMKCLPFPAEGSHRGDALRLLLPPAAPWHNDIPFRVALSPERSVIVPAALNEVAAPSLLAAMQVQAPMLLSGLRGDMLDCDAFREAVRACLTGRRPVVVTAEASAVAELRRLTPPETQLWLDVPEDAEGQSALLESLVAEAALRF